MGRQLLGNICACGQLDQYHIRFLLVLSEIVGLESKALDFVLAFPQADLDVPVYMELPAGMEIAGAKHEKQHVLLLLSVWGQLNFCASVIIFSKKDGAFAQTVCPPF
jgi:hypothetical protein